MNAVQGFCRTSHPAVQSTVRLNVSASFPPGTLFPTQESTENELRGALEFARDMDKKHGLCTEPSQKAWDAVDEIYRKIEAFREIGDQVVSNNARMQSTSGQNASRKVMMASRTLPGDGELKGTRYFF